VLLDSRDKVDAAFAGRLYDENSRVVHPFRASRSDSYSRARRGNFVVLVCRTDVSIVRLGALGVASS
jgi:hypothetical protein